MSILQALQDFLEGYEGMELRPLGEILTDLTRAAPPSYSLAPAGGGTDTQDVVGNRYYTADTTSLPWSAQGTRRIGLKTTTFWSPWRAGWRIRKIKGTIQNCPDVIPWKGSRFSMPRSTMFLRTGRGCIKYKSN